MQEIYDVWYCPFCGNKNIYVINWAKNINVCHSCKATFILTETEESEREHDDT